MYLIIGYDEVYGYLFVTNMLIVKLVIWLFVIGLVILDLSFEWHKCLSLEKIHIWTC